MATLDTTSQNENGISRHLVVELALELVPLEPGGWGFAGPQTTFLNRVRELTDPADRHSVFKDLLTLAEYMDTEKGGHKAADQLLQLAEKLVPGFAQFLGHAQPRDWKRIQKLVDHEKGAPILGSGFDASTPAGFSLRAKRNP